MDRRFANLSSFITVTAVAVAAGLAYIYLGRSLTFQAMLILMTLGTLGLLVIAEFGITRECILLGIGFTVVISPVKTFGFQEGDIHYMWVVQHVSVSAFDALLLLYIAFYARNIMSTLYKWMPKPLVFLILGYVVLMILSLSQIGPSGHPEVTPFQLIYEGRCLLIFAAMFTLIHNPSPRGLMYDLRCILIGLTGAVMLETAIVCLEYIGVLHTGPLLMGIRVGSHREGLGFGEALRVGGTFQHPNYLSVFCGGAFLLLWQTQMDTHPEAKHSFLYWPGVLGAFLCLTLTLSRSGWAGTFAGGMVYVSVMLISRGYPWLKSLPWKYAIPALILIIGVGFYMSDSILDKLFHSDSGNVTSRQYMNDMTVLMWLDNPWLGVGLGQHGFVLAGASKIAQLAIGIKTMPAAHNSYLVILSEIGIFGAVFYFLIPFYAVSFGVLTCLKRPNHRATAILCGACTAIIIYQLADLASISLRHSTLVLLYWFYLGIIFGLSTVIRKEAKHQARPLKGGKSA